MNAAELLRGLVDAGLALGAAALLLLAIRRPWRRVFGARAVPPLWALLPWAVVLSLWPSSMRPAWQVDLPAAVPAHLAEAAASRARSAVTPPGLAADVLLAAWGTGALLVLAVAAGAHGRIRRSIGHNIRPPAGCRSDLPLAQWTQAAAARGPALVGLWRPRIVLPAGFAQTTDAETAALVLAHEHEHARRGDLPVQGLAWLTLAVFWFVPPLWWAWPRLREDQELACDAALLSRGVPAAAYARALLSFAVVSSRGAGSAAPLLCGWPSRHPLVKRIAMIETPVVSTVRRRLAAAALISAALGMALGCSVMAAPAETVQLAMKLRTGDSVSAPVVCQKLGEPASIRLEADGKPAYTVQLSVFEAADGQYRVESSFQGSGDSAPYWAQNWQLGPGQAASMNGVRDGLPSIGMELTLERGCPTSAGQAGTA